WDTLTGWRLTPPMDFFPDLTLLVGVSGAGKTQILRTICRLRDIARDRNANTRAWGVSWRVTFHTAGKQYTWSGELEKDPLPELEGSIGFDSFFSSRPPRPRVL